MYKAGNNLIGISGHIGSGKDTFARLIQLAVIEEDWRGDDVQGKVFGDLYEGKEGIELFLSKYTGNAQPIVEWQIKKFADKLKTIAGLLIGEPREKFELESFKNSNLSEEWTRVEIPGFMAGSWIEYKGDYSYPPPIHRKRVMTVRELLQWLGTEAVRNHVHPNAWVNALFADYKPKGDMVGQYPDPDSIEYVQKYPKWIITDVRFPNEAQAIKSRDGLMIRMNTSIPGGIRHIRHTKEGVLYTDSPLHASETSLDNYKDWDEVVHNTGTLSDLYEKAKQLVEKYKLT